MYLTQVIKEHIYHYNYNKRKKYSEDSLVKVKGMDWYTYTETLRYT